MSFAKLFDKSVEDQQGGLAYFPDVFLILNNSYVKYT